MREKFKSENLFRCDYSWKSFHGIRKNIGYLVMRMPKLVYQRARYGACEIDTWNLDISLCNFLSQTLEYLSENAMGYPGEGTEYDTYEKWTDKLKEMADDWEAIGEFDALDDKYYHNDFTLKKDALDKAWNARVQRLDKAIKDLKDNFDRLWD